MAIDAVERGKGQANRLHVGVNACSFAGGMWSPFVYRLFLSPHASSVVSSSSPVRGHFHPSFSAAIRPELPRALAAPALALVLWRNVPRAPRNPWAPRAGFGRHSGFGSGFGLARRGSLHHHPRIRWGDLSYLQSESESVPPRKSSTLRRKPFPLRRKPLPLRRKPFTLRRKPFTLT